MLAFRFEYHENLITKHHLGKNLDWTQAARYAFDSQMKNQTAAIVSVRQVDADTIQIVKRIDQNLGMAYRYLGVTQKGLYERTTINRKDNTVAIDRMDGNWWHSEAFIGRRDLFYVEEREDRVSNNGKLTFVRHDFWVPFYSKFLHRQFTFPAAYCYRKGISAAASSK